MLPAARAVPPRLPRLLSSILRPSSVSSARFPSPLAITATRRAVASSCQPRASAPSTLAPAKLGSTDFVRTPNPDFLDSRAVIFDRLKAAHDARQAAQPRRSISVRLADGTPVLAESWETTPLDIARSLSDSLARKAVVARVTPDPDSVPTTVVTPADVDDTMTASTTPTPTHDAAAPVLWDVTRPLEFSCSIEILTFESDDAAKAVFWHSAAHVLGQCLETQFGGQLCIGPSTSSGFFYDVYMGDSAVKDEDYAVIRDAARSVCQKGRSQTFERLVVTKQEALELLGDNPFKVSLVQSKIPDGGMTSVYRCGPLIDLCTGPHIPDTGMIKSFEVMSNSSSYWLGDQDNDSLQRVYAVAFPDKKLMKAHLQRLELAKQRDHRTLGTQLDLFFFHPLSPGAPFMQPAGTIVYNKLMRFILTQYRERGYQEVKTPLVYNNDLWRTSGHAEHYEENMFTFDVEGQQHGLKPMNCPAHCLMFAHRGRSYRELPLRLADFGVLHRNELSGALTGLTRVRQFQQDDAHIFCTLGQIEAEITGVLEFMDHTYGVLGFTYSLMLSTRPESSMGSDEQWAAAEGALVRSLDRFGKGWTENAGDGSFYGPKIDVAVHDALGRAHQCATIQLDFQLPQRFNLRYTATSSAGTEDEDSTSTDDLPVGYERPVMIHRAILGSVERMMAMMLEHTGGKWPFWLSPRQVRVIPVGEAFVSYAQDVRDRLHAEGFEVDLDDSNKTLRKKVREAQTGKWNFAAVVGAKEAESGSVNLRRRDDAGESVMTVDDAVTMFRDLESRYE